MSSGPSGTIKTFISVGDVDLDKLPHGKNRNKNFVAILLPATQTLTKQTKQPCEYALLVRTSDRMKPKQIGRKS